MAMIFICETMDFAFHGRGELGCSLEEVMHPCFITDYRLQELVSILFLMLQNLRASTYLISLCSDFKKQGTYVEII